MQVEARGLIHQEKEEGRGERAAQRRDHVHANCGVAKREGACCNDEQSVERIAGWVGDSCIAPTVMISPLSTKFTVGESVTI